MRRATPAPAPATPPALDPPGKAQRGEYTGKACERCGAKHLEKIPGRGIIVLAKVSRQTLCQRCQLHFAQAEHGKVEGPSGGGCT